jgi:[ribosomal protein S18]-alanine N-acetyltransferase
VITVRQARREDVPSMMEIAAHAATAALWENGAYAEFFSPEQLKRLLLVIQENSEVAGFLAARQVAADEWEIENVAIRGSARRRGLGSRLLGEFLDQVRASGGSTIYLEVRPSNRAARGLYEKWAFVEAGVRKSYYRDPEEDALILRFSFPQQSRI